MRIPRPLRFAAVLSLTACTLHIRGQEMPAYALHPRSESFVPPPVPSEPGRKADVMLHYFAAGGWGIRWKQSTLLAAPYFSNHDLVSAGLLGVQPNHEAIKDGFDGTPFRRPDAILIGHGHIDHAGDVPGFFGPGGLEEGAKPALVADASTFNVLAVYLSKFGCPARLGYEASGKKIEKCAPPHVEITPLHSAHAPHLRTGPFELMAFDGRQGKPLEAPPTQGKQFVAGNVWAFLIDLLDDDGNVVFRIHYMDAAASPPHGFIPRKLLERRQVDVHIGCLPGYDTVSDYPETVLARHNAHYVLAGHWEDFFWPRDRPLKPVFVLTQSKMETFVDRIESVLGKASRGGGPVNKSDAACAAAGGCGPHGDNWAIPVPEETYWFVSGRPPLPPLPDTGE